ncbi:MAG: type II toxin-antitoxin system YafQ family toxin [bacterium]
MLEIAYSKSYRKNLKKRLKSGNFNKDKLAKVISTIINGKTLEIKHRDHELTGIFQGTRECHIEPDLLLIYEIDNKNNRLNLVNIGNHSEFFD